MAKIAGKTQYEIIADALESAILTGGEFDGKLPSENKLAHSYGVSRPVVREALKLLKARGIISGRQGAPTVIKEYDTDDFSACINRIALTHGASAEHIYGVRIALEVASVASACQCASDEDLALFNCLLDKMNALAQSQVRAFATLDTEFHTAIAKASGNPLLSFTTQAFAQQVEHVIVGSMKNVVNDDAQDFHTKIVQAIRTKDIDLGTRLMRAHLTKSMENYKAFCLESKEVL